MRSIISEKLEKGRVRTGDFASDSSYGFTGAFFIQGPKGAVLKIISSNDIWEHVSVSTERRCPNWEEMCFVKDLFWSEEECVIQFHPPKNEYVNYHPYCLHLWKHRSIDFPLPPSIFVGPK